MRAHTGSRTSNLCGTALSLGAVILFLATLNARAAGGTVVVRSTTIFGPTDVPPGLTNVLAIATGQGHVLALKGDGTVVAWGAGNQTNVPPGLSNVVAVVAGSQHSLALKSDGTVAAWGQFGLHPAFVPEGLSNVVMVAGGFSHALAIKNDGTLVVWSDGDFNGDWGATNVPPGLTNITAVAPGGGHHSLVLLNDDTVFGWGDNGSGEINEVHSTYAAGPIVVSGQLLSNIVAIGTGLHPSLALKNDGTVVSWPNDEMPPPPRNDQRGGDRRRSRL